MFFSFGAERDILLSIAKSSGLEILWQTYGYGFLISAVATIFGMSWAYICRSYQFKFKLALIWLLAAPVTIPIYVFSFTYLSHWQNWISYEKPHFLFGLVFVLATYPYSFLFGLLAFQKRSQTLSDQAELMGWTSWQKMKLLRWPMIRPYAFASFLTVYFEYLSDFGASHIFGIQTLSTTIYKIWNSYFSFSTASLIALFLMMTVIGILGIDRLRREYSFATETHDAKKALPFPNLFYFAALTTVCFAFLVPLGTLFFDTFHHFEQWPQVLLALKNSILLSTSFSIFLVTLLSFGIFLFARDNLWLTRLRALNQFGYALPGTSLAVAVTIPFFLLQRYIPDLAGAETFAICVLFFAWTIRFIKVAWDPLEKSRLYFSTSVEDAAQIFYNNKFKRWLEVYFPLIRSGLLTAFFILFIESMKELPITLLTRPYGWDTLTVKIFEFTSESEWQKAAPYGLIIVIFCLINFSLLLRKGIK
ncbi:MAG: ABC transporter permease [Pseudobdellovibrionaceae bacterium]|jgi:iron(III) transport system permease protein